MSVRMADVLLIVGYFAVGLILVWLLRRWMDQHSVHRDAADYFMAGFVFLAWPLLVVIGGFGGALVILGRLLIGMRKS